MGKMSSADVVNMNSADDIAGMMTGLGKAARAATPALAKASSDTKNNALRAMAKAIRAHASDILSANAQDVETAKANNIEPTRQFCCQSDKTLATQSLLKTTKRISNRLAS